MHLWLRKNIFYCRVELPRIDGKRRWKRISLHTNNYYEARTIMDQQQELSNNIKQMRLLFAQVCFDDSDFPYDPSAKQPTGVYCINGVQIVRKISDSTPTNVLKQLWTLFKKLAGHEKQLPKDVQEMVITIRASKELFEQKINIIVEPNATVLKQLVQTAKEPVVINQQTTQSPPTSNHSSYSIGDMFDSMLLKGHNCHSHQVRKRNAFELMLKGVGLKWGDDYCKFHNVATIENITKNVLAIDGIKNEGKRTRLGFIREIVTCACNIEPDIYKVNVIANLPKVSKSKRSQLKPHMPYSQDQLLAMFDPKYDFFKKNPDAFWLCMIGLFTGARANAAMTLQYDDLINEENLDCIYFRSNADVKRLKNDASERKVPIHNQLLDLGFVDYFKRKQKKLKANGSDFIFSHAVTKTGQYNNKYMDRILFPFFKSIGVKGEEGRDGHDYHSFRKVISTALQDAGVPRSYIEQIGGWEGVGTVEKSYSNHNLAQIKAQMDKMEYDFLKPHFAEWKKIMAKKP